MTKRLEALKHTDQLLQSTLASLQEFSMDDTEADDIYTMLSEGQTMLQQAIENEEEYMAEQPVTPTFSDEAFSQLEAIVASWVASTKAA